MAKRLIFRLDGRITYISIIQYLCLYLYVCNISAYELQYITLDVSFPYMLPISYIFKRKKSLCNYFWKKTAKRQEEIHDGVVKPLFILSAMLWSLSASKPSPIETRQTPPVDPHRVPWKFAKGSLIRWFETFAALPSKHFKHCSLKS